MKMNEFSPWHVKGRMTGNVPVTSKGKNIAVLRDGSDIWGLEAYETQEGVRVAVLMEKGPIRSAFFGWNP